MAAGQEHKGVQITLNTSAAGAFSETLTLTPTGSNASGYSGALAPITIKVEGVVVAQGKLSVAGYLADPASADLYPGGFVIVDTAADVAAQFATLRQDTHLAGIQFTDSGTPSLTLGVQDALAGAATLGLIPAGSYSLKILDAAAALEGLTPLQIAALGKLGASLVSATDAPLVLSLVQILAFATAGIRVTSPDNAIEALDTAAHLQALTADQIATLAKAGVTALVASDASVSFGPAASAAIVAAGLSLKAPANDYVTESFADGSAAGYYFDASGRLASLLSVNPDGSYAIQAQTAGTFAGVDFAYYIADYTAGGVQYQTRFYDAGGALLASKYVAASGDYAVTVGGVVIERGSASGGTFAGVHYASYIVDYTSAGVESLIRFFDASGEQVAFEVFSPDGGYAISAGGVVTERKVEGAGTFEGLAYAAFVADYTSAGVLAQTRFYDAGGALVASQDFAPDGGYAITVGGQVVEQKITTPGVFDGAVYDFHIADYSATGSLTLDSFYDASGALVASESFAPNGGYAIAVGGVVTEQKIVGLGTFAGVSYGAFVVDYTTAGVLALERFYDASGKLVASESFAANGSYAITVGASVLERKIAGAGVFAGETYAYFLADYDRTGFLDLYRFYDASGSLVASQDLASDGSYAITVGGSVLERKIASAGVYAGESYAYFLADYDKTGFLDLFRFYDAGGSLVASEDFASNGSYALFAGGALVSRKDVLADGSYAISSATAVPGAVSESLYDPGGARTATALDNADSSGALTLFAGGETTRAAVGSLGLTVGGDVFSLNPHALETIDATGFGGETFSFGSGFGADKIEGFVASGPGADIIAFDATAFADINALLNGLQQQGADTLIRDGANDSLLLVNVQKSALSAANFKLG